ncbi:hypothetical protein Pmani_029125 [Petrolisthes manimaculis]|uniref:Major facilitator superfamily (MFS) profile domain-containing protein n=1 Tax=Petrolisthes manimaculis TaxID=1843537 RepID=A0AAE1NZA6_9EUCA|nr:hypothetical protein Pmani_029125 [Petrolisthes manimaculis]
MTTNVEDTKKFDDVMSMLGTGKWNIFTMTIVALWYMMLPAHYVGPSFLIPDISHTCVLPLGAKPLILSAPTTTTTTTTSTTTTTTTTQNPSTITYTTTDQPESERVSQCEYVMVMNDTEKVQQCIEWHFDNTTYGTTLTEEFKLVCDRRFLRPLYASIYFMGAVVGLTFFGYVSDRYGRRVAITSSIYTYILLANILNWMPNFNTILALRFILGITDGGFLQPGYTLTMECFQSSHRSIAGLTIFLPWIFGLILMGGVFKLFLNWFW